MFSLKNVFLGSLFFLIPFVSNAKLPPGMFPFEHERMCARVLAVGPRPLIDSAITSEIVRQKLKSLKIWDSVDPGSALTFHQERRKNINRIKALLQNVTALASKIDTIRSRLDNFFEDEIKVEGELSPNEKLLLAIYDNELKDELGFLDSALSNLPKDPNEAAKMETTLSHSEERVARVTRHLDGLEYNLDLLFKILNNRYLRDKNPLVVSRTHPFLRYFFLSTEAQWIENAENTTRRAFRTLEIEDEESRAILSGLLNLSLRSNKTFSEVAEVWIKVNKKLREADFTLLGSQQVWLVSLAVFFEQPPEKVVDDWIISLSLLKSQQTIQEPGTQVIMPSIAVLETAYEFGGLEQIKTLNSALDSASQAYLLSLERAVLLRWLAESVGEGTGKDIGKAAAQIWREYGQYESILNRRRVMNGLSVVLFSRFISQSGTEKKEALAADLLSDFLAANALLSDERLQFAVEDVARIVIYCRTLGIQLKTFINFLTHLNDLELNRGTNLQRAFTVFTLALSEVQKQRSQDLKLGDLLFDKPTRVFTLELVGVSDFLAYPGDRASDYRSAYFHGATTLSERGSNDKWTTLRGYFAIHPADLYSDFSQFHLGGFLPESPELSLPVGVQSGIQWNQIEVLMHRLF